MIDHSGWRMAGCCASNGGGRTMSKIEINSFSGIRPVISADKLSGIEAQTANNCKVRSKSLVPLLSDVSTIPSYRFEYEDGFGSWSHVYTGNLHLGGSSSYLDDTAPSTPKISTKEIINRNSVTAWTFTTGATVGGTGYSINQAATLSNFDVSGDRIRVTFDVQGAYHGSMTALYPDTAPITAAPRTMNVTVSGTTFSIQNQKVALPGDYGDLILQNISAESGRVVFRKVSTRGTYCLYAPPYKATFEFVLNFGAELGRERAVVYRVTTVNEAGIESPASAASNLVTVGANMIPHVASLPSGTKRLYRAAGSASDSQYYFVAEVYGTSYDDLIADADLGEAMPDIENPPTNLAQVVRLPGGFLAGFKGRDIYFSDPYMLYSWNSDYTLTSQYDIVGIATRGEDLIVLTDTTHYIISGATPDVMTMTELSLTQPCSSMLGICSVGTTVGYVSPDGFVVIDGNSGRIITDQFYSRDQWQALVPANIKAKEYDGNIMLWTSTTSGLILDYTHHHVTTFSGGGAGQFTWKSKVFSSDLPIEMHVAQVTGASGSHALTLWADGVQVFNSFVEANTDLPLTRGMAAGKDWEIQISGSTQVDGIVVIHRERIILNGPVRITKAQTEGSWRRMLFLFPTSSRFKVIRARSSTGSIVASFYRDASSDSSATVNGDAEVRLTQQTDNDLWEVDIQATGEVYEVLLVPRTPQVVGGLVSLRNVTHLRGHLFHFPSRGSFKVGRVRGSNGAITGTLNLYADEAVSPTVSVSVSNDVDFRITGLGNCELVEAEFIPSDQGTQVDEILLVPRRVETVDGPVVLRDRPTWKGMLFQFRGRGSFKVARVRGPAGTVTGTLNFYANEAATATVTVAISSDVDVRLTGLGNCELVEVEFIPTSQSIQADEIFLMPRSIETVSGPIVVRNRPTWKGMLFQFPEKGTFKVGRLRGPSGTVTGTLNFYVDESASATVSTSITTDADFRITGINAAELVEVEFVPTDQTIQCDELVLIPRTVMMINGPTLITRRDRLSWRGMVFAFHNKGSFKVGRIRGRAGSVSATLNFYADEAASATVTTSVSSDVDFRITGLNDAELVEVEVVPTGEIDDLLLIPRQVVTVTGPVVLSSSNRDSWKGMLFQFPDKGSFKVARVRGRAGSVSATLNFYENEAATATSTVSLASDTDVRLTGVNAVELVEVELVPTGEIDEVVLIPRTVQTVNGPIVLSKAGRLSWKGTVVQFPDTGTFKVARIRGRAGSVSATLNLYSNEAETVTRTISISSDTDVRLDLLTPNELWEIEVVSTGEIDELVLIPRTVQTVNGPVVLRTDNRLSWKGNVFYFPRRGWFKVARVRGNPGATLGTLNLRSDESNTVTLATTISNDTDLRLAEQTPTDLWEVEMTGNGDLDEVILWPQFAQDTNSPVIRVARGESQAPASWLAREFRYPEPVRMRTAQIKSRTYPVTLTIYCDGSQVAGSPYTVSDASEFRLSQPISSGRVWEFDASASGVLDEVVLWAEQLIPANDGLVALKYDGVNGVISTLAKVIQYPQEDYFSCVRVHASSYPVTLRIYRDGGKTVHYQTSITNDNGRWLPKWQPARKWEVDAVTTSGIIYSINLAKSMSGLRR